MERSQRQLRVAEQLRQIIAQTLLRGDFTHESLFDAGAKLSVTHVQVSPDLKNATAFVTTLMGKDPGEQIDFLNEEHSIFQRDIAKQMRLKFTPKVRFKFDASLERVTRLDALLDSLSPSKHSTE
ncbi:MAG: 30S ribosome-binding factor RbfA [Pseudobdellovibrionaceae bacterium]